MSYCLEYKNDWDAKLIFAKDEDLLRAENIKHIDKARWIWSWFYCRVLMRGKFTCEKECGAKAVFYCDNNFDLYVNGNLVANEVKEFDGEISHIPVFSGGQHKKFLFERVKTALQ